MIDHGASLYFHHSWDNWEDQAIKPFIQIKDHVLLKNASDVELVDKQYRSLLTEEVIRNLVDIVPSEWLIDESRDLTAADAREVYVSFFMKRLAYADHFLNQIKDARKHII
ncbi:hypothetical protein D3C72_2184600 [compost metagenome]